MTARPSILFTAAYGAGLATGLLHFGDLLGAGLIAAGLALGGRPILVLLATAGLLGRLGGELARAAEQGRCAAWPDGARLSLSVRLVDPVDSSGGRILVHPLTAGCAGAVGAWWPEHAAETAGRVVRVRGRWLARSGFGGRTGGTLMVTEVGHRSGRPNISARLRSRLAASSQSLYGARAPMVDALILGRRAGLDPDLEERFARSGLVHLLSISGFHVGLITAWIYLFARLLRVSRSGALVVAAAASIAYVVFLGWPAPAARAAALAAIVARCRVRQRRVQANSLLSATCLCVMLVDPWAVLDLGGWLSASALWGASTFTRWSDRALGPGFWWRTLASSAGATLATAPITAMALGTVALAGLALNFVAIPLAAMAVPGVAASLLIEPLWPGLARALAAGSGLALHLLELAAAIGAAIPGGHTLCEPGELRSALPWGLLLAAALWALGRRNTPAEAVRRAGWVTTVVLWVCLLRSLPVGSADSHRELALHFLDVGQGDGAVLRTPGGHWVLVDAGPAGARSDAGRRVVAPFLARQGARRLAVAVVSHAHADHLGGVSSVLKRFPTGLVLEPAALDDDPLYTRFLTDLASAGVPWHPARAGERFELDGVRFTLLHPDPAWTGWGEDLNEDSLVLLVEYGGFQALFTGDAGFAAEQTMRARVRPVDLLKVGHHGSRGSTGPEWLDSLRPKVAVISVGRNDYGHPSPEALGRLAVRGVAVRRTDRDGTVKVTTDGEWMRLRWRGGSERHAVR